MKTRSFLLRMALALILVIISEGESYEWIDDSTGLIYESEKPTQKNIKTRQAPVESWNPNDDCTECTGYTSIDEYKGPEIVRTRRGLLKKICKKKFKKWLKKDKDCDDDYEGYQPEKNEGYSYDTYKKDDKKDCGCKMKKCDKKKKKCCCKKKKNKCDCKKKPEYEDCGCKGGDDYGKGKDDYGKGKDDYGKGKDDYGKSDGKGYEKKEEYGKGKDYENKITIKPIIHLVPISPYGGCSSGGCHGGYGGGYGNNKGGYNSGKGGYGDNKGGYGGNKGGYGDNKGGYGGDKGYGGGKGGYGENKGGYGGSQGGYGGSQGGYGGSQGGYGGDKGGYGKQNTAQITKVDVLTYSAPIKEDAGYVRYEEKKNDNQGKTYGYQDDCDSVSYSGVSHGYEAVNYGKGGNGYNKREDKGSYGNNNNGYNSNYGHSGRVDHGYSGSKLTAFIEPSNIKNPIRIYRSQPKKPEQEITDEFEYI